MKLTKSSYQKWLYTALSFLIPFLGMMTVLLVNKYSPFGKLTLLYSDMYHQYYPFFKAFRQALLSGESLLYNWSVGLGVDYLGLISYYLGSPLNLLSVFLPESAMLGYFSMLMPIKLGLASMFFGIFLQKIFQKNDLSIPLFSSFYGLCAWALGYQWNIMWLDTFALLPLVMLGMVRMLRDRKVLLYTITLFLSIAINYYIGLFTCFFVLITFFLYEICRVDDANRFLRDFFCIAIFSVIAIGMTTFVTLPALAALQNTQSSVNAFPKGFQINMTGNWTIWGLFDAISQVAGNMNGGIAPSLKEGLPNVYCGVFATIFGFLYLFCPKIRMREKICAGVLLLFITLSFIIRQLDYIWHGFHFTNMIPYRFAFLYSFVLLYMAYAAWVHRKEFQPIQIILAAVAGIAIIFCHNDLQDKAFLAYNGALLLLYIAIMLYHNFAGKPKAEEESACEEKVCKIKQFFRQWKYAKYLKVSSKQLCSLLLLAVIAGELVLNLVNFSCSFPPTNAFNYPHGTTSTADVIAQMNALEADDPSFFRAEVTQSQTLNDGALNGYNGISTFTSSANVNVTKYMVALGYSALDVYNRYCYEDASPVANLFLNLKYMIERDGRVEENPYFDTVYNNGNVYLQKNNAYLPLGFLVNSDLLGTDFTSHYDKFRFQNELMKDATGLDEDVWYTIPGSMLTITSSGPSFTPHTATGYCAYSTTATTSGTITYSFTVEKAGFMCIYLDLSLHNDFSLFLNGKFLYNDGLSLPQMSSVCTVKPGDVVEVRLTCRNNENGTTKITAAILDEEKFRKCYDKLAQSTWDITKFTTTDIEGTIHCVEDGLLYTSIPDNGNWKAIVDGEPTVTVAIGNAMVAVPISEGTHTVRFVYENKAFTLGVIASVASAVCLAGACVIMPYWEKRKKKKALKLAQVQEENQEQEQAQE